jgi:hypothetical protein
MMVPLNESALLINSLVTFLIGFYIFYLLNTGRVRRHFFYVGIGAGFLFYGAGIFVRWLISDLRLQTTLFLFLSLLFFIFTSLGFWSLAHRRLVLYVLFVEYIFFSSIIALWLGGLLGGGFYLNIGSFLSFLTLIALVFYHRVVFGESVDRFLFGWMLLLVSNVLLFGMGWVVDVLAIFSKLVIFYGVTAYDFAIISQRLRSERLTPVLPLASGGEKEGGFTLVVSHSEGVVDDFPWIRDFIEENVDRGLFTSLFVFQDVLPYSWLRRLKWMKPDLVSILVFSSNLRNEEEFILLPMELKDIGLSLVEVAEQCGNSGTGGCVIFYDLSQLIYVFGLSYVYRLLLDKMGIIRKNNVSLYCVIHPKTHSEPHVLALFKSIADNVLEKT